MKAILRAAILRTFIILVGFSLPSVALGYSFISPFAPFADGVVSIDFRLGSPNGVLIDGSISWNTVLQSAAAEWNSHINTLELEKYSSPRKFPAPYDGINQIYWDDTIDGFPFGDRTLAVTTRWSRRGRCTEADIVFNVTQTWNSYRGPLLPAAGGDTLNDIYRVGVHELGHVLGLDHPDEHGQSVSAVMNSTESDVDDVTADDIAGAQYLYLGYGPIINQQPVGQTIAAGTSTQFTVQASGVPEPTYQWYFNGVAIPGATTATLLLQDARPSDSGTLKVLVANRHGSEWSRLVTVAVLVPPSISAPPLDRNIKAGLPVTFSVVAAGSTPLTYSWTHNGTPIPNATGRSLMFTPTSVEEAGEYSVTVVNAVGTASASAHLSVSFPPQIVVTGGPLMVLQGSNVAFTADVQGTAPFTYQWFFRSRAMLGANLPELLLTNVSTTNSGTYVVEVRNAVGKIRSAPLRVQVIVPPFIKTQPKSLTVSTGRGAVFSVVASGTRPFSYQWLKDSVPIPNATRQSLVLPAVQSTNAGLYSVRVSNVGAMTESAAAMLTVLP